MEWLSITLDVEFKGLADAFEGSQGWELESLIIRCESLVDLLVSHLGSPSCILQLGNVVDDVLYAWDNYLALLVTLVNNIVQSFKNVALQEVFITFENDRLMEFLLGIDGIDVLFIFTEVENFAFVLPRKSPVLDDQ